MIFTSAYYYVQLYAKQLYTSKHPHLSSIYSLYISMPYHTYVCNLYTYTFKCYHYSILKDDVHIHNFENCCDTDQVWLLFKIWCMVCVHTLIRGRQESLGNVQFLLKVNVSRTLSEDILLNKDQRFRYISDFMQL